MNMVFRSLQLLPWMFFVSKLLLPVNTLRRLFEQSACYLIDTPRLVNISEKQSVLTGHPARLHCFYEANPPPQIKWYHINPRSGDANIISGVSKEQQYLDVRNATYIHEGTIHNYTCRLAISALTNHKLVYLLYSQANTIAKHPTESTQSTTS